MYVYVVSTQCYCTVCRYQAEYAGNTGAQDSWFSYDAGGRQTEGPGNYDDDSHSILCICTQYMPCVVRMP